MPGKQITILDDSQWTNAGFTLDLQIDPNRTALGVIDVQHYCMDPSAHLAHTLAKCAPAISEQFTAQGKVMIENIQRLQAAFRNAERRVFFTRHGSHLPDGYDMIPRRRRREKQTMDLTEAESGHLPIKGFKGHEILDAVAPKSGELILDKNTSSAFHSSPIHMFLNNMGIDTIVLTGVAAEQCVLLTAFDAADRGVNVIIAADACAGFDPGIIEASFIHFGRVSGYVWQTDDVIRWIETGQAAEQNNLPAPAQD